MKKEMKVILWLNGVKILRNIYFTDPTKPSKAPCSTVGRAVHSRSISRGAFESHLINHIFSLTGFS